MSRKGIDTPASTRIRENQRRSRERRKELIENLQKRVHEYEQKGVTATQEMQKAARRVAQENAGLRSLLARHGVSEGEVNEYLRSYSNFQDLKGASTGASMVSERLHDAPSDRRLDHKVDAAQSCCRDQVNHREALYQNVTQHPTPDSESALLEQQMNETEANHSSAAREVEPPPDNAMNYTDTPLGNQIPHNVQPEEPECPNTADCFCPPPVSTNYRPPSHDLEISCEAAATIIVDMRGDGDIESARARLGCFGRQECNVKNSTVLQIMDEG